MFEGDRRATSITVGYVLNFSIAAIMLSALLMAGGGLIDDQTQRVTDDELTVVGHQVANELSSADRMTRAGNTSELSIRSDLPERTAAGSYTLTIDGTADVLVLETSDPEVRVSVPFRAESTVRDKTVGGGPIRVDLVGDELVVSSV